MKGYEYYIYYNRNTVFTWLGYGVSSPIGQIVNNRYLNNVYPNQVKCKIGWF